MAHIPFSFSCKLDSQSSKRLKLYWISNLPLGTSNFVKNNVIDLLETYTDVHGQRPPYVLVTRGHIILEVTYDYVIYDGFLW